MIDFEVLPILNEKVFAILDVSDYETFPDIAQVEIQFPNFKKRYSADIVVDGITSLNTKILKQDDCLNVFPDGIYTLHFKIDDIVVTKKHFRTISAWKKWAEYINDNKTDFNTINKIYLYLRAAEGVCDNDDLAKEFYNIADKLLKC